MSVTLLLKHIYHKQKQKRAEVSSWTGFDSQIEVTLSIGSEGILTFTRVTTAAAQPS
jgi:hypothetical protein